MEQFCNWGRQLLAVAFLAMIPSGCLNIGCSANHWLGDTAGKRPGVSVERWSLFGGAKLEVTSDCEASIGEMRFSFATPGDENKAGSSQELVLRDARFGQVASAVVREEPAKILATGEGQMSQVEYARVTWQGVKDLAHEIMPIVGLFSGVFGGMTESGFNATFPGGLSIGRTKVTKPSEAQAALAEMLAGLKRVADTPLPVAAPDPPSSLGGAVPPGTQPTDEP